VKQFDLAGQAAIVTGSSRGIGFAIAEMLAEAGANVTVSGRNQDTCDAAAARINVALGVERAIGCAADLSDKTSLEQLVKKTRAAFGRVSILVGNAATNPYFGPSLDIPDVLYRMTMEQNLLANHWLVQLAVPDMIEVKNGAIVLISSVGAYTGSGMIGIYNIAKAGIDQMVRNLAVELGPHNIRVNGIAPGSVRTELSRPLWEDPEKEAALSMATVLGRIAEPHELAGAALYLSSPAGSFTTGQVLLVDGGRLCWRG
jgi:NAD(P)-dependent dehydrogenase (short-subunit alcohol dehydrogenase family)